jgi:hypothetical protein
MMSRKRLRGFGCAARRSGRAHAFAVRLAQFASQPHSLVGIER